jgi:signal transduction histidine kinase
MAKPRQSSFRRILLRRLLLLSIPVLVTGEVVAYQKARSGLLETARLNLSTSAARKTESLRSTLAGLRSNLVMAASAAALQSDSPKSIYEFLDQVKQASPLKLSCVQLIDLQTQAIAASTCGDRKLADFSAPLWLSQTERELTNPKAVQIALAPITGDVSPLEDQLNLVLSAPVLSQDSRTPRYALSVQTGLYGRPDRDSNDLMGYTVVVDQDGTILAHPNAERVGRKLEQEPHSGKFQTMVQDAISGRRPSAHIFSFEEDQAQWLAGYSAIPIAMNETRSRTWIVLAITPLDQALSSLAEVKHVLIILTIGLLTAILLATLYLTRDLARPIEKLSDYAAQIQQRVSSDRAPKNFKVRELNYLAEALDNMVERLEDRAQELETAWQEAHTANQIKSEFLATTSHELRTPLNAIVGCVRLVRDGCCDDREEELEFLKQADDAALHLLKIINDLLDIAKIEAGKVELNLQPISVQDLCNQCLKMVEPGAEMKRLKLSSSLDPHIDRVLLDERRVRQMVINLLSNAVKFTPEGGRIHLRAWLGHGYQLQKDPRPDRSPINPETIYLCLEVEDSGIGIPKERWHLLFRPFQQIDSSLTRKHEGTGLGLSLTKRLAELHGGTLSFISESGRGSTFRIWLPLLEPSPNLNPGAIDPSTTKQPVGIQNK